MTDTQALWYDNGMYNEFLQQLIQLNFLPLGIVLFLAVFLIFNRRYEGRLTRQFIVPQILLVVLMIIDNADYFLINMHDASMLHVAVIFLGYNVRISLMLSLLFIASRDSSKKERAIASIPAFINLTITSMAFFNHMVYWVGDDGNIMRGPLSYTPHIICGIYALILFWYARKVYYLGRTNEMIIIVICVVLTLAGTAVETIFRLRGILICVIAMDTTFYYLYIHIEHFKVDTLTGALNRLTFYADIERMEQMKRQIHIISVDLNGLKQINDTYGHTKGDEAIKYVAHIIQQALPPRARLYRIGGDEFVVLYPEYGLATSVISDLKEKSKGGEYTFAVGEFLWDGSMPFEKAYMEADKEMYACKKHMKEEAEPAGVGHHHD